MKAFSNNVLTGVRKRSVFRLAAPVLTAASLGACATIGAPDAPALPEPVVADTYSARLADATARELSHLARFDPAALETVDPQLRALAAALATREFAPSIDADAAAAPPPPPDMGAARSVLHAVHLASYRRLDNAHAGWATLSAAFPDALADRTPRLEEVDIPDRGLFLRLKAGPFDTRAEAETVCRSLQAAQAYCEVTDFTGTALTAEE